MSLLDFLADPPVASDAVNQTVASAVVAGALAATAIYHASRGPLAAYVPADLIGPATTIATTVAAVTAAVAALHIMWSLID